MLIRNVRLGFATNSSSTHSLVFLRPGEDGLYSTDQGYEGQDFGWEWFSIASRAGKASYLAQALKHNLPRILPDDVVQMVVREWTSAVEFDPEGYIDHDSSWVLPNEYGKEFPSREFFNALRAYVEQPGLVILGGNDNDDPPDEFPSGFQLPLNDNAGGDSPQVCRKDPAGFWVLFNRDTGSRIVIDFREKYGVSDAPLVTHTPMLVDLKATDHCPYLCNYCYQGSTLQGRHADTQYILAALYALHDMQVFEVAIGGGEPTLHPDFRAILGTARRLGVTPSFSTRNLAWFRDHRNRDLLRNGTIGAIGFSVDAAAAVSALDAVITEYDLPRSKFAVHYVVGPYAYVSIGGILHACHDRNIRIVLLGYKTTGRGAAAIAQDKMDTTKWLDEVRRAIQDRRYGEVGVDTALAAQYEDQLKEAGARPELYQTAEGINSMYIDAVAKTAGPCSFDPPRMIPLPSAHAAEEAWTRIRDEARSRCAPSA